MVQSLTASRNIAPLLNQRISPERPCSAVLNCLSLSDLILVMISFSTAYGTFFHDLIEDDADLESVLEPEALVVEAVLGDQHTQLASSDPGV